MRTFRRWPRRPTRALTVYKTAACECCGGWITVGHVPAAEVERLLRERHKALGLSVPGMPWGSPGMERPDGVKEAYVTLLLLPGGAHRVFARHA